MIARSWSPVMEPVDGLASSPDVAAERADMGRETMQFRIVAPHTHYARVRCGAFTCVRTAVLGEAGLQITWAAYRGESLLKQDCRTLNEAKNLCRLAASDPV
jgi:hypothetical protein